MHISYRSVPKPEDRSGLALITRDTGFFSMEETEIACELLDDVLARGEGSDYRFLLLDGPQEALVGYSCFGRIPGTVGSWDLYWLVISPRLQRQGYGRGLLAVVESQIRDAGGQRIYVDTSMREQYIATRGFYLSCGYEVAATLADFYGPDDGKVIYCKVVAGSRTGS